MFTKQSLQPQLLQSRYDNVW